MATGNFKVKPSTTGSVRAFARLQATFKDLRPYLGNAAAELTRRVKARFLSKRDPDGASWVPWSPRTKALAAKNPARSLMMHTRALRNKTRFEPGRTGLRAILGTPYGRLHEQPDGKTGGRLPRRAFLFSARSGRRALGAADEKYLLNALRYQLRRAAGARK